MKRLLVAGSCLLVALLGAGPQQFQRVCSGGVCRLVAVPPAAPQRQVINAQRVVAVQPAQQTVVYQQASYGYTSPVNGVTYRSRFAARRPVLAAGVRVATAPVRFVRRVQPVRRVIRGGARVVGRIVFGRRR